MSGKRYEQLRAFHACDDLVLAVYEAVRTWPKYELYGLTSQARRAAFSSAANIAEGTGKRGKKEFRRYLDIALGSLSELSYILRLAHRLEYVSTDELAGLTRRLDEAGKLTFSLAKSLDGRT